jgi:hypothetical protein
MTTDNMTNTERLYELIEKLLDEATPDGGDFGIEEVWLNYPGGGCHPRNVGVHVVIATGGAFNDGREHLKITVGEP